MRFQRKALVLGVVLFGGACSSQSQPLSSLDGGPHGAGGSSGGVAGGGGTVANAATGGTSGGGNPSCAAPIACPGTTSGPWCVESLGTPTSTFMNGLWADRADDVWVAGAAAAASSAPTANSTGAIFHWDGCTWTPSPLPAATPGLFAIWGAAANDIWAVGNHGTAVHWNGSAWSNAPVGADLSLTSVSGTSGSDVWTTWGFHWNGNAWTRVASGAQLVDVSAVAPNDAWATGGQPMRSQIANVAHWDGTTWTTTPLLNTAVTGLSVFGIWGGPGVAWAVGEGEMIWHFTNGAWTQIRPGSGSSQGLVDVMQSGADVYAVGLEILHAVGNGPFQHDANAPTQAFYTSVWMTSTDVWVLGQPATVLHQTR
jgi:hypothetical protein